MTCPDWHPLRDPAIIRPLPASPYARDSQRLARQELQRLLRGTPAEQDLLGLLTAARGGLSGPDLAELTGVPLWEIEDDPAHGGRADLRPPAQPLGTRRPARRCTCWAMRNSRPPPSDYLGGSRLAGYQDRLHAWARNYRDRGWPPDTPEYLLAGYFQLLAALGDLPRHDRLRRRRGPA